MTFSQKLISFHIVESENNLNYLTWSYPTISSDHEKFIIQNQNQTRFFCLRKSSTWFYFFQQIANASNRPVVIVLLTKEFDPVKYRVLCNVLGKKWKLSLNPVELVKLYLNFFTLGSCSVEENGTTYTYNFKNLESPTNLKGLIQAFDLEIILIYTAILLKRRVVIFNQNIELLQKELLAITNLVPCRNVDDYLNPLLDTPRQLKGLSFYVAGTTEKALIKLEDLYDLFVNMETKEITISPKSEEVMVMTKIHKDVATSMVKLAASDLSDAAVKERIQTVTQDLLNKLKTMASVVTENNVKMLSMNDLKSKNYQPAMENFLFNLAIAENVMML